jgi:hypothetical protein
LEYYKIATSGSKNDFGHESLTSISATHPGFAGLSVIEPNIAPKTAVVTVNFVYFAPHWKGGIGCTFTSPVLTFP